MTSGIYKIKFKNGAFYIGKSNNIARRWNEHINKFNKGTAARSMQHNFNVCGMPKFEVIRYCHEDHIDLLESIYIRRYWSEGILNTTKPPEINTEDEYTLLTINDDWLLDASTGEHLRLIYNLASKSDTWQEKYEEILNRDEYLKNLIEEKEKLEQENRKLQSRTFWNYLFG